MKMIFIINMLKYGLNVNVFLKKSLFTGITLLFQGVRAKKEFS